MKHFIKRMVMAFLSGVAVALMCIAVSADVATGPAGYYDSDGYYYFSMNSIATGSTFGWGTTSVTSQQVEDTFPVAYVGILPILYDSNTKKIASIGVMTYNSSKTNTFSQTTPYYYNNGSFYSQGITRAYTSDTNAIYYPYYQYGTFASPIQSIPG